MTAHVADRVPALRRAVAGAAGAVPGAVVGAAFGAIARARRAKPLHPRGRMGSATLTVDHPLPHLQVPLLAVEGSHRCLVRWSRSVGLPAPLPDVEGLALRLQDTGSDLLFASTGARSLTRFLLMPRGPGRHGPQTTLLPVSSAAGPLVFMVQPVQPVEPVEPVGAQEPPTRYAVSVALGAAAWKRVGTLEVTWGTDRPCRFDPVVNQVPGTEQYPVVQALREPAYLLARRGTDAGAEERGAT